jgi:hypothetical protein
MDWRYGSSGIVPLCKHEALSWNLSTTTKKEIIIIKIWERNSEMMEGNFLKAT